MQRITTLKDYEKNIFKYIDINEITDENIKSILESDKETDGYDYYRAFVESNNTVALEKIKIDIKNIIVNKMTQQNSDNFNENDIVWSINDELITNISLLANYKTKNLHKVISEIIKNLISLLDVSKVEIPVIIYKNVEDKNELIEIFTKLNSEGVQLSKYDIYSASWQDIGINVSKNEDLIEYIIKKYEDSSEKSGLEINDFDSDAIRETGIVNLFEYAYSLAKMLSENSSCLYKAKNGTQVDSLGFTLLAGLLNVNNKKMDDLPNIVNSLNLDFVYLANTVLEVFIEIEKELKKYVTYSNSNFSNHSEMQLASYILTAHKLKFKISDNGIEKIDNKEKFKDFKFYLHKHYLYDILRGFWSGSGDSKLEELIQDLETNRYYKDVDKTAFTSIILQWFEEQNKKECKQISVETKLVLNYLHKFSKSEIEANYEFDFDHIIPKKIINRYFVEKDYMVSISPAANIAFIPSFDNRSKREKTFYQLSDTKHKSYDLNEEQLNKYFYPKHSEIRFVESDDTMKVVTYKKFLEDRANFLSNQLIGYLYRENK